MNDNIPVGYNNEGEAIGFADPRARWLPVNDRPLTKEEELVTEDVEEKEEEQGLQAEDIVFNPKNLN